jgi:hypothetical protein
VSTAAVLLEVVLALSVFVSATSVILAGVTMCAESAKRLKIQAVAADLAVTLSSELQMGLLATTSAGPSSFQEDRLAGWTWEVRAEAMISVPGMQRVEVIVTHVPTGRAHRLVQWMDGGQVESELVFEDDEPPAEPSTRPAGGPP